MKKSTRSRDADGSRDDSWNRLRALFPQVTLYWWGDHAEERREARIIAWGFLPNVHHPQGLRVIVIPRESRVTSEGLRAEQLTFARGLPLILTGWGHPEPPGPPDNPHDPFTSSCRRAGKWPKGTSRRPDPKYAPGLPQGPWHTHEEYDRFFSSYVTPDLIFAEFSEENIKLIPGRIAGAIPPLGATDQDQDPLAYVLLYRSDNPLDSYQSPWKWFVTEYDPDRQRCRGLVISPFAQEVGDFTIPELKEVGVFVCARWNPRRLSQCIRFFGDEG